MDMELSEYDKHVFIVNGAKISASFPKETNDTVMDTIKDILASAYIVSADRMYQNKECNAKNHK